jgi:hypothetical protein
MKLLYKPIGIVVGIIAGVLSRKVFDQVWQLFDDEEPPTSTEADVPWTKVLSAAAVQGLVFSVTRALVERAGATGFERMTGIWPGDKREAEK